MQKTQKSIAVAMSGGVDSSVSAALLQKAGYKVIGFTFRLWDQKGAVTGLTKPDVAIHDAKRVCEKLGIEHHELDFRQEFEKEVVSRFEQEYLAGRTPNPCVFCNPTIKWGKFWEATRTFKTAYMATGHYARVDVDEKGIAHLKRASDIRKEQSYFLWKIPKELLKTTIFPLSDYEKPDVRKIAAGLNLPVAEKSESQEVCFIPDNDYRKWLLERKPELATGILGGEIVDKGGKKLGEHPGYPFFTIGQRKGLGLGGGRKYYVSEIDAENKRVHLGDAEDLLSDEFYADSVNIIQEIPFDGGVDFEIKIRYRDPGVLATVILEDDGRLKIKTKWPVSAVTPGQSAVVYLNDEVVAGGVIYS